MRAFFLPAVLIAILSFASCTSTPYAEEEPEYSEQYLQDEALLRQYKAWFAELHQELSTDTALKSEVCPAGSFAGARFGDEKRMFIFEPMEIDTAMPWASYFNTDPESNWLADQEPFLKWNFTGEEFEVQQHKQAEHLREMIAAKYFCVYVSDDEASSDPELDSIAETFTSGVAVGYAVIYDITTQKKICVLAVNTTNDDEVNYQTYADSIQRRTNEIAHLDAVFALRCNFYQNIRENIERQVMEAE